MCVSLPVLRVVRPDSSAHRSPNNDQELPQPYWGENSPVAPLDNSIQPQRQQHREQQQTGVDQELTAKGDKHILQFKPMKRMLTKALVSKPYYVD